LTDYVKETAMTRSLHPSRRTGLRLLTAATALVLAASAAPALAGAGQAQNLFTSLYVTEASGVVSASWIASPVLPAYRVAHATPHNFVPVVSFNCTLLYGYGVSTGFSVSSSVTTPTCSFWGVDTTKVWGVEVEAISSLGGDFGPPAIGFGQAEVPVTTTTVTHRVPHTIVCERGTRVKFVRGLNPKCPAHWHRIG
jgi:hypothetical protein